MQSDLQKPWFSQHQPITKSFRLNNLTSNAKWTSFQQIHLLTSPPRPTPHPQGGGAIHGRPQTPHPHPQGGVGPLPLPWGGGVPWDLTHRRFRGVSPACPIPRNREIGFVSSSFSSRAVRASGRGEAGRAHVDRYSYRWASRELVSTGVRSSFRSSFVDRRLGFNSFWHFL